MFLKIVRFDIRNGLAQCWWRYVIIGVLFFAAAGVLLMTVVVNETDTSVLTYGDYLLHPFAGMKEYVYRPNQLFDIPALWLLVFLLFSYFTLSYPYRDLQNIGQTVMVSSESRVMWWLSKCLWVCVSVICFYIVAGLSTLLFVLLAGGDTSLTVSQIMPSILDFGRMVKDGPWDFGILLIEYPIMTIAICLFQLLLSLLIKPLPSYIFTISMLFLSAYFKTPFLLGNYLMSARSSVYVTDGVSPEIGIVVALTIAALSVSFGALIIRRIDIFGGEVIQ